MNRVIVSEDVSAIIKARIVGFPVESDERIRWLSQSVAEFGALPLYLGWADIIGIRPDGEIVSWNTEGDYVGVRPVVDRTWIVSALVEGVRRYPELRAVLPEREPGAVDCPCHQHPLVTSGKVICGECGGIGWLPAQRPAG